MQQKFHNFVVKTSVFSGQQMYKKLVVRTWVFSCRIWEGGL